jgi:hypothetical protein
VVLNRFGIVSARVNDMTLFYLVLEIIKQENSRRPNS